MSKRIILLFSFVLLLILLNGIIFSQIFPSFFFADDFYILNIIKEFNVNNVLSGIIMLSTKHFFTPLPFLAAWIVYQVFGLNPSGYYLLNFTFHLSNAILIYFIFMKISKNKSIAIPSAILFIVYCGNWESLGWTGAVNHIIYAFFMLLTILWYIYDLYLCSLFAFMLAIFSHETALFILPALLSLYEVFIHGTNIKPLFRRIAPYLIISFFFLMFKIYREIFVVQIISEGYYNIGFHFISNYLGCISTLIVPITSSYRSASVLLLKYLAVISIIKIMVILFVPFIVCVLFKYGSKLVKFLAASILLILLPYSFFDLPIVSRYLYEASIFFTCLIVVILESVVKRSNIKAMVLSFLIIINLSGMYLYQKAFYEKKELRRSIIKEYLIYGLHIKPGASLCFIDLPVREDEIESMIYLWDAKAKHIIHVYNADNVYYKQTYNKNTKYNCNYVFVYDCIKRRLSLLP